MELTEEKIFSAFGLDTSEKNPEGADPDSQSSEQPDTAGEREPEFADPVLEPGTDQEDDEEDGGDEDSAEEAAAPGGLQTAEERRANAARRRAQETQAAINAAVQEALAQQKEQNDQALADFFKQAGLTNPFTKQPITNMEEFRAWKQAQSDARLQQELRSGKLTQETLKEMIDAAVQQTPAVQAAIQQQEQAEDETARRKEQQFQRDVEAQLTEIRKSDPSIQSVRDLLDRPWSRDFYAAVKRGNNFLDAYYLATRSQAAAKAAASAQQRTLNNMRSKEHLKRTGLGGRAGATITPDEEQMYHLFNPEATPEQIQAFQNRVKKG